MLHSSYMLYQWYLVSELATTRGMLGRGAAARMRTSHVAGGRERGGDKAFSLSSGRPFVAVAPGGAGWRWLEMAEMLND